MTLKKTLSLLFSLVLYAIGVSQTVATAIELEEAIDNAVPGTTISLKNKVWKDVFININKAGTASLPITIQAETSGNVYLEGNSKVNIKGSYIIFKGIVFQNASNLPVKNKKIPPVIRLDKCDNCTITQINIDGYNGTPSQEMNTFKWILTDGKNNEISYSSFTGKKGIGSIINDNRNDTEEDFLKIHHNYFADRTPVTGGFDAKNNQDAIRIGNSKTSLSDSSSEVYDNYFYNFSGEIEIISNCSGNNKYYNNTFRNYQGSLTLRHGNNCEVYGNFFFGEHNPCASGIRVIGEGHKIYNNYFEGTNYRKPGGIKSKVTGAINVSNGRPNTDLNGYSQVKDVAIINNTFADCDLAVRIGTKVKKDLSLAPSNLTVANNVMINSSNKALQEITAPIDSSEYQGNISQNGDWDLINGVNNNNSVSSGQLKTNGDFYELLPESAAINSGKGNYPFLKQDVFGATRQEKFDAGAEEFGTNRKKLPLTNADIGKTVGFGGAPIKNLKLANLSFSLQENSLEIYPVPSSNKTITINGVKYPDKIVIYDDIGKLINSVSDSKIVNSSLNLNLSTLEEGIYFLKFMNHKVIKRIVIK